MRRLPPACRRAGRRLERISRERAQRSAGHAESLRVVRNGRRHFCGDCGTGLFYYNAVNLPGIADVQIATLDDPDAIAPMIQVQAAERLGWMERAHELPAFERYPSRD